MKKFPIEIHTFEDIIQDNYLYVDKTGFIYSLITEGKGKYLSGK